MRNLVNTNGMTGVTVSGWKRETGRVEDDGNLEVADIKASLAKAIEAIDKRQKLIRLADSSSYGWATVSEYKSHQLADNEDDDAKITRTENRAARKAKQKRAASTTTNQQQKKTKWDSSSSWASTSDSSFRRSSQSYPYLAGVSKFQGGSCFICGSFAHWRATCQEDLPSANQQLQPPQLQASTIFTKVIRPLVKKWRSEGKSIVVYLDDGLGFAATLPEALVMSEEIIFNSGIWREKHEVREQDLRELAKELPDIVLKARAGLYCEVVFLCLQ
ncbi:uncharacterized protein LOC110980513 [Acanthaster planci]|uniref:Uncharacterized protein LOC110980513 n=1 Tax=Acanthaster planci TaxID=133434 RepID=A0A8B7YIA6_ACAPL|nr:uncharacterized protein LOC110980513 [Acanthaster planci]